MPPIHCCGVARADEFEFPAILRVSRDSRHVERRLRSDRVIDHEISLHAENLYFAYLAVQEVSGYWNIGQGNEAEYGCQEES